MCYILESEKLEIFGDFVLNVQERLARIYPNNGYIYSGIYITIIYIYIYIKVIL